MLALLLFTIKELEYRTVSRGVLDKGGHDLKKSLAQPGRATFGDVPVFRFKGAGLTDGASAPAKAIKDCLRSNRRISPISAMSCVPRTGPVPNIRITTGYSGSCEASVSISCWITEIVSMIVLS